MVPHYAASPKAVPVMMVMGWANSIREARLREREHIREQITCSMTLLNAEQKMLGMQLALSYARSSNSR